MQPIMRCVCENISLRSCVHCVLRVELKFSRDVAPIANAWCVCVFFLVVVVVGRDVRKFSVLKAEFQYPAFVGLVMYLCQIDQCLGLDWSC